MPGYCEPCPGKRNAVLLKLDVRDGLIDVRCPLSVARNRVIGVGIQFNKSISECPGLITDNLHPASLLPAHQNSAPSDAGSESGHQNQVAFLNLSGAHTL